MDNMRPMRNSVLYIVVAMMLVAFLVVSLTRNGQGNTPTMDIGQVAKLARAGDVDRITVNGQDLTVETEDGKTFKSRKEDRGSVVEALQDLGVPATAFGASEDQIVIQVQVPSVWTNISPLLFSVVPVLLMAGFFIFLMRQAQGAGNQAFSFGKSRARVFTGDKPTVTFQDVAGAEEAKQELQEVVEFLKEPQKFASLGARIPKGVLLVGPPGTGKTLMAKAISGEAGVPFFSISGSEFVEMFVGVGASRVRDLFEQAKKQLAVHHLHRRDRRRGAAARRRAGRQPRRARADAEPDPGGDGRVRHGHERDRDRGDQPAGHPGSGAAAAGALRPAGSDGPAGREGAARRS